MDNTNLTLEQVKENCSELENEIIEMYLCKRTQREICDNLDVTRGKIDHLVKKFNLTRFKTPGRYNLDETRINIYDPLYWYFLGLFASDGCISKRETHDVIEFEVTDIQIIEDIKSIFNYDGKIGNRNRGGNSKTSYYINIINKKLSESIHNIFEGNAYRKSNNLIFPKIPNKDCESMFIRGFWDGDGSFSIGNSGQGNKRTYIGEAFCQSSKFLEGLQQCLNKHKINSTIPIEHEFRINSKEDTSNFIKFIYSYNSYVGLPRKRALGMLHLYYCNFNLRNTYECENINNKCIIDFNFTENENNNI